ncbi:MAG TPA: bifunctional 4-hydroxy-2-oxoglutarate aldolase/2-dehydro-3-deoxy-phosphogluconate aldolase [Sphingomicrobium sp.]|jgi:2-dehydro-3-deoxyphosphogluconate aldolase/(4S)-4-hydroxy-2-oxoglutarate aldolase|nr:bifunctional 4-hydroxy-2-oxoglutarate aldolase/2-dehydro-3-deoxy-phosphogluconate aldolase [Sphingomicrobium sp.]
MTIDEIMRAAPVIPVLVLDGEGDWAELAETFVGSGLAVLEVTLRTPSALDAIARMSKVEGAIVGAGTVLNEQQLDQTLDAGAKFIVSPGLTKPLAKAVERSKTAFLPGVASAGDIMRGLDLGLERFKFFPAEAAGGIPALKALSGPFSKIRFCPTGGIRPDTASEWLALEPVLCVGGSWLYRSGDSMDEVEERARAAFALRG